MGPEVKKLYFCHGCVLGIQYLFDCAAKCHLVHLHGLMIACFIVSLDNRWPGYWEKDFFYESEDLVTFVLPAVPHYE